MSIEEGHFYKVCAVFPHEVNESSPLKSHLEPLTDVLVPRKAIGILEETSAWYADEKLAKGRTCYVVEFDREKSIGVVFLGTTSVPGQPHRFMEIEGEESSQDGILRDRILRTVPPKLFRVPVYLDATHPLRVRVVCLPPGYSTNLFKHVTAPPSPPPPVGVVDYNKIPVPLRLDHVSENRFSEAHMSYHQMRPRENFELLYGKDGRQDKRDDGGDGGGDGGGKRGRYQGEGSGWWGTHPKNSTAAKDVRSLPSSDAPWGKIGTLRIGIDIPAVENPESDSEEEEEGHGSSDTVDALIFISDYKYVECK